MRRVEELLSESTMRRELVFFLGRNPQKSSDVNFVTALNFLPDPDAEDVPVAFLIIVPRPSHQTAAAASRRSLAEGNDLDDEDWR